MVWKRGRSREARKGIKSLKKKGKEEVIDLSSTQRQARHWPTTYAKIYICTPLIERLSGVKSHPEGDRLSHAHMGQKFVSYNPALPQQQQQNMIQTKLFTRWRVDMLSFLEHDCLFRSERQATDPMLKKNMVAPPTGHRSTASKAKGEQLSAGKWCSLVSESLWQWRNLDAAKKETYQMNERDKVGGHCSASHGHEEATLTSSGLAHKQLDPELRKANFS